MKILKKGEAFNGKATTVKDGAIVQCTHSTAHKSLDEGARFVCHWDIDFSECPQDEILKMAAEHVIIKIRREMNGVEKPKSSEWDGATFNAVDYIVQRTSKVDKAKKMLAAFSDDELAAMGLSRVAE